MASGLDTPSGARAPLHRCCGPSQGAATAARRLAYLYSDPPPWRSFLHTPTPRERGRQSQPCGAGRKFGSSGAGVRGRLCVVEIRKNLCKLSHEKTWSYCEFPIGNRSRLHLTSLQCSELTVSRLPCPSRVTASSNFLRLLRQAPACCDGRRTLAQHSTAAAPAWPAVARRGSRRCPTCGAHESCLPRRKARRRCQWSSCSVRRWWPAR